MSNSVLSRSPSPTIGSAPDRDVRQGRAHERGGRMDEASAAYERAIAAAETKGITPQSIEALHRLGVICHHRNEPARARALCQQSYDEAMAAGNDVLAAEALNAMAGFEFEAGDMSSARERFLAGLELGRAEASREMALLYQTMGRNQDALRLLNTAHRLFRRLNARVDMVDVGAKVAELEGTFLKVVADWDQSIESSDRYTYGHCGRVAEFAIKVAITLGLQEDDLTTIRLGAHLHDLGKVRIPHEILNKPGKLTDEEFAVVKMHPIWGLELLAAVDFPWDIKPIIRWHHEKYDGTGYPDRLKGDEIPLHAQIICIADVYDALTSTRSYREATPTEQALEIMTNYRHWWRSDVYEAFMTSVGAE